ncbi:hypothetical protein Fmac_018230 [Flemingia macrophylla]|uniref:Uncharacterized protein n=1 Tax=Flemingia macrophylla TaxID=520843 RepID=A0ABD1M4D8_9FABA
MGSSTCDVIRPRFFPNDFALMSQSSSDVQESTDLPTFPQAGGNASKFIKESEETKKSIAEKEVEVGETLSLLNSKLETIGNLIHDSVPISNDEANNVMVRSWGEKKLEPKLRNHVDLVELLEIVDTKKALINFGLDFLDKRQYTLVHTTLFFMRKDIMSNCEQLAQFDEELYKLYKIMNEYKNPKVLNEGILWMVFVDDFGVSHVKLKLCNHRVNSRNVNIDDNWPNRRVNYRNVDFVTVCVTVMLIVAKLARNGQLYDGS